MRGLIDTSLQSDGLNPAAIGELETFQASEGYAALPTLEERAPDDWPLGQLGLALLRVATDALLLWGHGKPREALERLERTLSLPLVAEPLEGRIHRLGVFLAGRFGGAGAADFEARLATYGRLFLEPDGSPALSGWMALLEANSEPWFARFLAPGETETPMRRYIPGFDPSGNPSSSFPVYRGHEPEAFSGPFERDLNLVVLLAPDTGEFVSVDVQLHTLMPGGVSGRWAGSSIYADLEIAFPPDQASLVAWALAGALELVLSFTHQRTCEFSSVAGDLSSAPMSGDERRLRLSLRLPHEWAERDVPLGAALSELEGALLSRA